MLDTILAFSLMLGIGVLVVWLLRPTDVPPVDVSEDSRINPHIGAGEPGAGDSGAHGGTDAGGTSSH